MNDHKLCTAAWLLVGWTGSEPGILRFENERLIFTGEKTGRIFDTPLSEITNVNFPRQYFGAGLKMQIGATEYRLSFIEPENVGNIGLYAYGRSDGVSDLTGRKAGKAWKSILIK